MIQATRLCIYSNLAIPFILKIDVSQTLKELGFLSV